MNFKDMLEKISQLSEATEKTKTGVKHTGKYGKEYDTDEEGEEKKEPVAKRGRGRPAKDSEETKFDTSALSKAMGGKKPKKEVGTVSKKHTLKDWIENVEKNLLNEAPTPVPVMQQGSNKPAGAGIVTINDPNLKNTLGPTLDNLAQQKKISVVTTGQTTPATTGGSTPSVAQSNQNQQGTQAMAEDNLDEKIEGGVKLNPAKKGMFKGKTKAELTSQYNKLKASGPHKKGSPENTKMHELAFAIRAKSGWGKVDEADIASTQGIDTEGANLGAGRNPNAFESKMKTTHRTRIDEGMMDKIKSILPKAMKLLPVQEIATKVKQITGGDFTPSRENALKVAQAFGFDKMGKQAPAQAAVNEGLAGNWQGKLLQLLHVVGIGAGAAQAIGGSALTGMAGFGGGGELLIMVGTILLMLTETFWGSNRGQIGAMGKPTNEGKKAKPDYIDLDKDGDKKESMKKAAADKKKKAVKESANHKVMAARLEGKAHGLKGHPHCGKNYDDMDECMAYHTGYKEGLDECYGMSSAGMMETEGTMPAATTPGMASQAMAGGMTEDHDSSEAAKSAVINRIIRQHPNLLAKHGPEKVMAAVENCCGHLSNLEEIGSSDVSAWVNNVIRELKHHDVEEGNAFTGALAKTPKGGKFTVGGKTFTDNSNYDSKIDEYAFESWDKELSNLLNESTETINEGLTVSVSKGQQGSPDSVSINASDSEADQVLAFIKQAGLGLFGDEHGEHLPATVPGEHAVELEPAMPKIDVVDDHEGMMALMRKMSGGDDHGHSHAGSEDYADEESTDEEACNECGMAYESCGCEKEMVDEVESEDQMMYKVAEDNPPDNGSANSMNATKGNNAANTALAIADKDGMAESEVSEGWDPVKEVKQSAIEYMKSAGIRNVHDLDAEAIQYIGDENQINYEEVCKILGCKLPEELGPVDADDEIEEGEICPTCHKDPCECDHEEEAVEESFAFESLYKKLAMIEAKESTRKKDNKAEKAGKKVTKDIEYDEGHKGKDDKKAEKAGKKVKKDIEYDDKKDKKLDEWANDAGPGKSVSDTTFEQDIDFMTKVIAGGLNKQKSTGQTTIPVVASQLKRQVSESTDSISDWKKLAGLK